MLIVKRQIIFDSHEEALNVSLSPEHGNKVVEIYTQTKQEELYWGRITITTSPKEDKELAQALLDTVVEADKS